MYFGIWWSFWAEHGFPLYMAILRDSEGSQSMRIAFQGQHGNQVLEVEVEDEGKYLVVGYKLPEPCTDCSALIDKIVRDIDYLLREDDSDSSADAETP